ncbi:MAG: DUF721 domain-containing protein [Gammaproteobacteria bacterium]|nr:DUF721 domain-containing protein [Gammaproteobacteria bacterium]
MHKKTKSITEILEKTAASGKLLARSRENLALEARIKQHLQAPLDQHCLSALNKEGVLIIYVDSSTWASRFRYFARQLADTLKTEGLEFKKIVVRVQPNQKIEKGKRKLHRAISGENCDLLSQVAESLDDPALKAALKRFEKYRKT